MNKILRFMAAIGLFIGYGQLCFGGIILPGPMSDGMVLQRRCEASIWGKATPGAPVKVTTSWNGKTYKAVPSSDSLWIVKVATGEAGGPYNVTIRQGGEKTVIEDVLIGEVWLCSGQSNMQMPLMGYRSQPMEGAFDALVDAPSHKRVRLLKTPRILKSGVQDNINASWKKASLASASEFSAIGWFFASRLSAALDVPVGIIESDWGATRIEAWMPREAVEAVYKDNGNAKGTNAVQALYDCMIMPLHNYTLKGFLWYQGESNKGNSSDYAALMAGMAASWREAFGGGEAMPFFYVMIAPFQYSNGYDNSRFGDLTAPMLWEAQRKALDLIPNSDIAITTDIGDPAFIHPPKKKAVADRLVMLALHHTYGDLGGSEDGISASWRGPIYKNVTFNEGQAVVSFDTPGTLCPVDPLSYLPVEGFEIAGEDRVFFKADAYVRKAKAYGFTSQVVVRSDNVPNPVAVRYAFHNYPEGNLTDSQGLPAMPFRTDDWEIN